jgi:hypothetical protein
MRNVPLCEKPRKSKLLPVHIEEVNGADAINFDLQSIIDYDC